MNGTKTLRWIARLWAVLSLLFLLAFVVGEGIGLQRTRDLVAFLFFPLGVGAGLVVAWWRERLGGLIAVGSLVVFYLTLYLFDGRLPRGPYFLLVAAPGVLFLLLGRKEALPA